MMYKLFLVLLATAAAQAQADGEQTAEPAAEAEAEAAPVPKTNKDIAAEMAATWGKGELESAESIEKYFAAGVKIDATAQDVKNTGIYKKYEGHTGMAEWLAALSKLKFIEFAPTFDETDGDVTMKFSQQFHDSEIGRKTPVLNDAMVMKFSDGKIEDIKFTWNNQAGIDQAFVSNLEHVKTMFKTWQKGELAEKLGDFTTPDVFVENDDATKAAVKESTGGFERSTMADWLDFVGASFAFTKFEPTFSELDDGSVAAEADVSFGHIKYGRSASMKLTVVFGITDGLVSSITHTWADPSAMAEIFAAPVPVVFEAFGEWFKGTLQANRAKYFTEDCKTNAYAPGMLNARGYKNYEGLDGVNEWIGFLATDIEFENFKPSFYAHESGAIVKTAYTMKHTGTGKSIDGADTITFTVDAESSKISAVDFEWGSPTETDAIYPKLTDVELFDALVQSWFKGQMAQEADFYFADDFVLDATASVTRTDMYKKYHGPAGLKEWLINLEVLDFTGPPMIKIEKGELLEDGSVKQVMEFKMKHTATGKSTELLKEDGAIWKFKDGKATEATFHFGVHSAAIDEVFPTGLATATTATTATTANCNRCYLTIALYTVIGAAFAVPLFNPA